jgi:circadian clock protein KaiB
MPRPSSFKFRQYLSGNTPNSVQARANLAALCRTHLPGRHEIEIVDIAKDPNRALLDGIYMTPSVVKLSPSPVFMIVGTLSRSESVLQALGLATTAA